MKKTKGWALIEARKIAPNLNVQVRGNDLVVLDASGNLVAWGRSWEEVIDDLRAGRCR